MCEMGGSGFVGFELKFGRFIHRAGLDASPLADLCGVFLPPPNFERPSRVDVSSSVTPRNFLGSHFSRGNIGLL